MAAASSNNVTNASHLTTPVAVVASSSTAAHDGGLVSSHLHSSQIILSNLLPPATSIRGGGHGGSISIHSSSPVSSANCHHITLTDAKTGAEIVPLLINSHHDHQLTHHHENYQHDILADSSTLIDTTTTSPIITTTTAISDSEHEPQHHHHHHQQMLNIIDDCTATSSTPITTSTLVQPPPLSSTVLSSSHPVLMKVEPSVSSISSMSNHNNNNTIIFETTTDPLIGVAVSQSSLTTLTSEAPPSTEFLQQCPETQLNNIHISENRVIVTQSTSSGMSSGLIQNSNNNSLEDANREMHDLNSVICAAIATDSCGQSSHQVHPQPQSQPPQKSKREDKSCSTDNLNLSISTNDNSLSSSSGNSDDIDLNDEKMLEEGGGYQDNTSSNSQQSGGGGSVSGGVAGGIGPNSYVSLIQPSIGQSGGVVGGHSVSGNLSGGPGIGGHGGGGGGISGGGGGPHHGVAGQTGALQTSISEQTDFKYLFEELCPVCGDKVSGYHYGLLTCESCKGFFKRTVQNKKVYTCVAERRCLIDKTQRKRCPYCRFQKCLDVGMKLEAVRADRMRGGRNKFGPMYKRDRARKLQMMRQRQLALQAIRGSMSTGDLKPGQISPTGYQQSYPSMSIKQEIQIPQSPDSSPSPIAIALGQVNPSTAIAATTLSGSSTNTTTVSGAGGGSGSCGPGSDNGSSSLQHSADSKICFDSGTNPSSTADSVSTVELRVSPMIREFVQSVDDREWQTQLFTLLQKQSYNQVEVDLFELMCKVLDQNLFSQVDWARNTVFFKDLKVDDQMKLLQFSWSDMLVLDHLHQRIHNGLPDETQLHNGQLFNLLNLGLLGVPQLADYFNELQNKLQELKFDMGDYVCMKFLILLNPNVRGIVNRKTVLEGHENVQAALLDYTLTCYPSVSDKFSRLLNILPEIHAMATRGEEHLYIKHCAGSAPTQTLLMEMLHAKRKV
ncbi:nuclear hormone receptor FTZ-F1 isoform X2 [Hermetia illucens]|uniref:nuclear hormone receptor FTZ-F1 isoform X2 n=1 Tax=Hermetia illucens TaxID=343691 RepID=UPI0018CC20BF|nr:nuclear hormone receptor FTZ-F1 isoform X2 [Hermetia illucens]